MNLVQVLSQILILCFIVSCETKEYVDEETVSFTDKELNEGSFFSDLKFGGVQSAYNITDSTVSLSWNHIDGAKEYHVFDYSTGVPSLLHKIIAPATNFRVSNLDSGTSYKFIVRIKDENQLMDDNTMSVSATTLTVPLAPSVIIKTNPIKLNDVIKTPAFTIFGVNPGDYVELFSDACTTKIADGDATGSYINLISSELTPDVSYTFYARRTNHQNIQSACSTITASYNLKSCPDGYIKVPANPSLSIEEFCVMKYEAKAWSDSDSDNLVDSFELNYLGCLESGCTTKNWGTSSYTPGSSSNGYPWRMLDIETAKSECRSLGDNYDLISNHEWMTIAENIEKQASNWSGAVIASGCLFKGNNGVDDTCSYKNTSTTIDSGIGRNSKASHTLSNGEVIWDFSGNVSEWVDWGQEDTVSRSPVYCSDSWSEIDSDFCNGAFGTNEILPFNPAAIPLSVYNNTYGLGMIEGGNGGMLVRGGSYRYEQYAGVFSASLAQSELTAREEIGFRCVYRIPHP